MMKAPAKSSGNKRTAGKLRLWVWVCAVLFFAGLTSTAFALWGGHRLEGNEGVKALYEYVRSYDQNSKDISQGKPEELIKRLLEEPFETSTDFELEQEDLNIMGLPIPRLSGNVEAKYDLQDLGLKARFFWFEWGLYLLGHEFVIDDLGKLQAAELPEAGLDAQMPLGERAAKLLPRLPDDDAAKKRVFEALAHSVPVNATHTEEALFYSPMDGRDTETEAVVTYLDAAALERTAAALIELMEEDANLSADISAMYAPLAAQFGEKDAAAALAKLAQGAQSDAYAQWTVYRRDDVYIGYSCTVSFSGRRIAWSASAEFKDKSIYEQTMVEQQGSRLVFHSAIDYEMGSLRGGFSVPGMWLDYTGTFDIDQYTNDAYVVNFDLLVSGNVSDIALDGAALTLRSDIRLGTGLETLEQSRRWHDIFDKQREEMLPGAFLPFGLFQQ